MTLLLISSGFVGLFFSHRFALASVFSCKVYDCKPGAGKLTIQIELPKRFSWKQFYSTFVLEQQEWSRKPGRMTHRALGTDSLALYEKFPNPNLKCEFVYFFYVEACLIASEF